MAVIYFDGDQTLWDFEALMRRTLAATIDELRRLRPELSGDLTVDAFVADRDSVAAHLRGSTTNLEAIRLAAFEHSLRRFGVPDSSLASHLNAFYLERRFASVDLFDDVVPVLEELSREHTIGLLSNGNSYPNRVGLERYFSATVFAQDHGVAKPDPRIYAVAEQALPGNDFVMVGDSITDDILGAQAFAWTAIWVNREGAELPAGVNPDDIVENLVALPSLL